VTVFGCGAGGLLRAGLKTMVAAGWRPGGLATWLGVGLKITLTRLVTCGIGGLGRAARLGVGRGIRTVRAAAGRCCHASWAPVKTFDVFIFFIFIFLTLWAFF